MNIVESIFSSTKDLAYKTAIFCNEREFSYQQLEKDVSANAKLFMQKGIKPFSRVGIFCPDGYEYIVLSLAVLKISGVVVPVPWGSSSDEIGEIKEKIGLNFLITYDQDAHVRSIAGAITAPKEFTALNPAFIRFSSGTTGSSKGVVLSHEAIDERTLAADKGLAISSQDVVFWVLQMSFHFVVTILLFLRRGATIVLCADDFPVRFNDAVKKIKPTFIYASPFHYRLLVNSVNLDADRFSRLRMAVSTAIALDQKDAQNFKDKFGVRLNQAYGIIEVGLPFVNIDGPLDSVGRVLPDYQIKLTDVQDGAGKIWLKGPGFFNAYFFPFALREDILKEGWFDTGDIGRFDDAGHLYILGRDKFMINFAGMKIFPQEVEQLINRYPAVEESLVYGLKDEQYGELPVAKVVLKNNQKIDIDELRKFCYKHLAKYKVPKAVELVPYLEKTSSGKLKRNFLLFKK